jgi:hypothetical protein
MVIAIVAATAAFLILFMVFPSINHSTPHDAVMTLWAARRLL